jgi:hypothetical protein
MTGSAYGQPGSGQELDLASGQPSPRSYEEPFDRIFLRFGVDASGVAGQTDIRVKGDLQPLAEFAGLCLCSLASALVFGLLSHLSDAAGATLFAVSSVAGGLTFGTGTWYLSSRPRPRLRPCPGNAPSLRRTGS